MRTWAGVVDLGQGCPEVVGEGSAAERDVRVSAWADLREVTQGEPGPRCGTSLESVRAIEVGHIFRFGRRYTTALGVAVMGPDGGSIIPIMGSYGIRVVRASSSAASSPPARLK